MKGLVSKLLLVAGVLVVVLSFLTSVGMLIWSSHIHSIYLDGNDAVAFVERKIPIEQAGVPTLMLHMKADKQQAMRVIENHAVSQAFYEKSKRGDVLRVKWRGDWVSARPLLVGDRSWVQTRALRILMGALVMLAFGLSFVGISVLRKRSQS